MDFEILEDILEPYYYLQHQAPAGNWVDSISSPMMKNVQQHRDYLQDLNPATEYRIVTKTVHILDC